MRTEDDIRTLACAECRCELVGRDPVNVALAKRYWGDLVAVVAGRVNDRPYCERCIAPRPVKPGRGTKDDESPWGENATRALEGE